MRIFLFFLLVTTLPLCAQKKNNVQVGDQSIVNYDQGKSLYDSEKYGEAIPFFEKAVAADPANEDALYYLGLCLKYNGDNEKAITVFEQLRARNPEYWSWYYYEAGRACIATSQYDKAVTWFEEFLKKYPNEPKRSIYIHQAKFRLEYAKQQKELQAAKSVMPSPKAFSEPINSKYDDYMPVLDPTGTKLYFTSQRFGGVKQETSGDKDGDEDLYWIEKVNGVWSSPTLLPEPINSANNDGSASFSGDGQVMVFAKCGQPEGIGSCDLYISTLEGNQWSAPVNMGNVVNSNVWEAQPTISADGSRIIFSSERPGGYGNEDLYMIERNQFGDWGVPMNLGAMINTPFTDLSPFLSQDGKTLYFASDGHAGFGSTDLFKSTFENGKWTQPINLGRPLNTEGSDRYFTIGGSGEVGFFASNRSGNLELYEIPVPEEMRPQPTVVVSGIVSNAKTSKPVSAYVMVEDVNTGELIAVNKSNSATGKYLVVLPAGRTYSVSANKEAFFFHSELFDVPATTKFEEVRKDIALKPIEKGAKVVLNNIFFETGKATLSPQSTVELEKAIDLMKGNPSMVVEVGGHTDNIGDDAYNMKLSHDRSRSVREYLIRGGINANRIQAKGYGESNPIASNDTDDGRKSNRRTEFVIIEF